MLQQGLGDEQRGGKEGGERERVRNETAIH